MEHYDDICQLNTSVDNKLLMTQTDAAPFKRWYIKNIEFSNFLSYGENQKIDFEMNSEHSLQKFAYLKGNNRYEEWD